jgi:hypothetical protein
MSNVKLNAVLSLCTMERATLKAPVGWEQSENGKERELVIAWTGPKLSAEQQAACRIDRESGRYTTLLNAMASSVLCAIRPPKMANAKIYYAVFRETMPGREAACTFAWLLGESLPTACKPEDVVRVTNAFRAAGLAEDKFPAWALAPIVADATKPTGRKERKSKDAAVVDPTVDAPTV